MQPYKRRCFTQCLRFAAQDGLLRQHIFSIQRLASRSIFVWATHRATPSLAKTLEWSKAEPRSLEWTWSLRAFRCPQKREVALWMFVLRRRLEFERDSQSAGFLAAITGCYEGQQQRDERPISTQLGLPGSRSSIQCVVRLFDPATPPSMVTV
jgi:hypothetical protein